MSAPCTDCGVEVPAPVLCRACADKLRAEADGWKKVADRAQEILTETRAVADADLERAVAVAAATHAAQEAVIAEQAACIERLTARIKQSTERIEAVERGLAALKAGGR